MIECGQAENLFDAYLNHELSASLTAELHAHVISCGRCGQELALLEACGDVVATDRIGPVPGDDFTDRVLAGWGPARRVRVSLERWRRFSLWGGAGVAAAAAIMLFVLPLSMPGNPDTLVQGMRISVGEIDADQVGEPLIRRMMVQTIRAMDATGRGARALGELGAFGLSEVHSALQRGLSEPGVGDTGYFGGAGPSSVATPLQDLTRILEEHKRAGGDEGLELM